MFKNIQMFNCKDRLILNRKFRVLVKLHIFSTTIREIQAVASWENPHYSKSVLKIMEYQT